MARTDSQRDVQDVLEKNAELLRENNRLLRKLHRFHIVSAWFKALWIALLIGLPFALYFYVLEPYFEALGSSYETFQSGIGELPGLKGFNEIFGSEQTE